jgi:Galactose-3-O-sulfotransferase
MSERTRAAAGPDTGRPPLLALLHIPKTAGTTLGMIMRRQYPDGAVQGIENWYRDPKRCAVGLRRAAASNEVGAVYGHFPFDLRTLLPADTRYLTMLRDPVERTISLYAWRKRYRQDGRKDDQTIAGLEAEGDVQIDNLQTRMLSGIHPPFGECTREMLDVACANLQEHFLLAGLAEHFDETLVLLRRALGWRALLYVRQRVGESRPARGELDAGILARIEAHNELDAELYAFAGKLFTDRLSQGGRALARETALLSDLSSRYQDTLRAGNSLPEAGRERLDLLTEAERSRGKTRQLLVRTHEALMVAESDLWRARERCKELEQELEQSQEGSRRNEARVSELNARLSRRERSLTEQRSKAREAEREAIASRRRLTRAQKDLTTLTRDTRRFLKDLERRLPRIGSDGPAPDGGPGGAD